MDDQEDSYAAFDDIRVQSVPEPSTLWLLTVACLAARCHRPKKGPLHLSHEEAPAIGGFGFIAVPRLKTIQKARSVRLTDSNLSRTYRDNPRLWLFSERLGRIRSFLIQVRLGASRRVTAVRARSCCRPHKDADASSRWRGPCLLGTWVASRAAPRPEASTMLSAPVDTPHPISQTPVSTEPSQGCGDCRRPEKCPAMETLVCSKAHYPI